MIFIHQSYQNSEIAVVVTPAGKIINMLPMEFPFDRKAADTLFEYLINHNNVTWDMFLSDGDDSYKAHKIASAEGLIVELDRPKTVKEAVVCKHCRLIYNPDVDGCNVFCQNCLDITGASNECTCDKCAEARLENMPETERIFGSEAAFWRWKEGI